MNASLTPALVLGLVAWAQAPAALATPRSSAQAPEERADAPTDAQARRQILHLAGGGVLRGKARRTANGGWEIQQNKEWLTFAASDVREAKLERAVLREAEERSRRLEREDLDARAAHVSWLRAEGLESEALEALERLLGDDPDHVAARLLVHEGPRPRSLAVAARAGSEPEARAALLDYGASAGAIAGELCVAELSALEDRASLAEDLLARLGDGKPRHRAFAAFALRRLFPGEALAPLTVRSVLDVDENVRRAAAHALRDTGEAAVLVPVLRALESANVRVRTQAAEAIGHMGALASTNALEPLIVHYANLSALQGGGVGSVPRSHIFVGRQFAYVQDFDVEVAQFQAVADPQINVLLEGDVLEARVVGVRDSRLLHERRVVRDSLRRLSGADPGDKPSDWLAWWQEHDRDVAPASRTPR